MSTSYTRTPPRFGSAAPDGGSVTGTRSCCCPARPTVLVVMPPVPGRPHETDLLLCDHHFRASRPALAAAGAAARRLPRPGDGNR